MRFFPVGLLALFVPLLTAQQPIGRTSATEVKVSGAVDISHGETLLGNGSEITAGEQAIKISLQRGGELHLCSTSSVHLSKDNSVADPASSALMMALDRGAIEANYTVGKYSDVLLTPDLRILISGPGRAELSIRVNTKGDTCVDNHGPSAPYVTVSSELEGGAYRVLPDQRVSFQHGSLREVVDHEPEPCGCPSPAAVSVASAGNTTSPNPAKPNPDKPIGGPSSTAADTAFPIAESEGLAPPPKPTPVPPRETHAQVTVPLTYNGENPAPPPPAPAPLAAPAPQSAPSPENAAVPVAAEPSSQAASPATSQATSPAINPASSPDSSKGGGLFHRLGHFFSRIFGK